MGRMSDMMIEVSELLERGVAPHKIAEYLDIPQDWVYQLNQRFNLVELDLEYEEYSRQLETPMEWTCHQLMNPLTLQDVL